MKHLKRGPHWTLEQRRAFAEALSRLNKEHPEWSPRRKVAEASRLAVPDDHSVRSACDQIRSLLRGKVMSSILAEYGITTMEDLSPLRPRAGVARMRAKVMAA